MSACRGSIQDDAEYVASLIGDDLLTAARCLSTVEHYDPDVFAAVVKHTGIGMPFARRLIGVHRQFRNLGVDRARLFQIGWTKLLIISRYIDEANCEELLRLAESYAADELDALMHERSGPRARRVVLSFTPRQYAIFEAAVLAHGGEQGEEGQPPAKPGISRSRARTETICQNGATICDKRSVHWRRWRRCRAWMHGCS